MKSLTIICAFLLISLIGFAQSADTIDCPGVNQEPALTGDSCKCITDHVDINAENEIDMECCIEDDVACSVEVCAGTGQECVNQCGVTTCSCTDDTKHYDPSKDECVDICEFLGDDICAQEGKRCTTDALTYTCDEITETENDCELNEEIDLATKICKCKSNYRRLSFGEDCQEYDMCKNPKDNPCNHHCTSIATAPFYECSCFDNSLYDLDNEGTCTPKLECDETEIQEGLACAMNVLTCDCGAPLNGYAADGKDIDECIKSPKNSGNLLLCGQHSTCTNLESGGGFQCGCQEYATEANSDTGDLFCMLNECPSTACSTNLECIINDDTNEPLCYNGIFTANSNDGLYLYSVTVSTNANTDYQLKLAMEQVLGSGSVVVMPETTGKVAERKIAYSSSYLMQDPLTHIKEAVAASCWKESDTDTECLLKGAVTIEVSAAALGTCSLIKEDVCNIETSCVDDAANGHYYCECLEGTEVLDTNDVNFIDSCIDIDECDDSPCDSTTQECINTVGSFECPCIDGYGGKDCKNNLQADLDDANQTSAIVGGVLGAFLGLALIAIGFLVYKMKQG